MTTIHAYRVVFDVDQLKRLRSPKLFRKAVEDTAESYGRETILARESPKTRSADVAGSDNLKLLVSTILLAKTEEVAEDLAGKLEEMGRQQGVDLDLHIEEVDFDVEQIMKDPGY